MAQGPGSLSIRDFARAPGLNEAVDSTRLGRPSIRIPTDQGAALVWIVRASDTVFLAASIPDSSFSPGDALAISIDTRGDGGAGPGHDDFQWDLHRVLDSSVVYRGSNGRWQPPRDDPDWRFGLERSGGGWEVSGASRQQGWSALLRLDPAWFAGDSGRPSRIAIRVYDSARSRWYTWPPTPGSTPPSRVEQSPALWIRIGQGRT
jgi:hypothetical protein